MVDPEQISGPLSRSRDFFTPSYARRLGLLTRLKAIICILHDKICMMKTRVTLTIDPQVLRRARRLARHREKSVSALVEELVRSVPLPGEPQKISFTEKWAGRFELVPDTVDDPLRSALLRKYF